jgi:hypothetical protein
MSESIGEVVIDSLKNAPAFVKQDLALENAQYWIDLLSAQNEEKELQQFQLSLRIKTTLALRIPNTGDGPFTL